MARKTIAGLLTAAVFFAVVLMPQSGSGMSRHPAAPAYVPGHVLIKFKDGVSMDRIEEIVAGQGARIDRKLGRIGVYLVILPEGADVMDAVDRFNAFPEVRYAEPDRKVRFQEDR